MDLQRILGGYWFARLVLLVWLICAVSMVAILKNMEFIVHIKLYEYGLLLNPEWLDPYTFYSSLIYYLCLAPPMALSGIALVSGLLKTETVQEKRIPVQEKRIPVQEKRIPVQEKKSSVPQAPQSFKPPQGVQVISRPKPIAREDVPMRVEDGSRISCPNCKKVFGRALVMLDFRGGQNRLVSVCPYCNYVLGTAQNKKGVVDDVHVVSPDEEIVR